MLHGLLDYPESVSITRRRAKVWLSGDSFGKLTRVYTNNPALRDRFPHSLRASTYIPTPDDPPWNALVAAGVWVASVLAIVIVPTLFVLPYLIKRKADLGQPHALAEFLQQDATAIILQIIAIVPAHIITLGLAWIVVTRVGKYSFRETLGWRWGGMTWWHYVTILLSFFLLAAIVGHYFPEQENDLIRILRSSRSAVFLVAFMATFTAPIVEEVVYRGLLYSALQRSLGVALAVAAVTLLFALVHLPQYYPSYSTMFLLLLLSLILTLVRVRTTSLLPCIILHTLFNGIQSVILILEPYLKSAEPVVSQAVAIVVK